jgi:hypothetical protein
MALTSAGVEVTVTDESFYVPADQGMVPSIIVATSKNKTSGTGTGTAAGTLTANAGTVYTITSQRELTETFGDPKFYTDTSGSARDAYELNEYGLLAAYSLLGVANKAFVTRADVNLDELTGSSSPVTGAPTNGTYWLDTAESVWGIKEWNSSTQSFTAKTPKIISEVFNLVGEISTGAPKTSFGSQGDYAINTTATNNKLWYKNKNNAWVQVGSGDSTTQYGSWKTSWPTIEGTTTGATVTEGHTISINGFSVIAMTGTSLDDVVSDINAGGDDSAAIPGVTAAKVNNKLVLYATDLAGGEDSTASAQIKIANVSGTALADLGITEGTYDAPRLHLGSHTTDPGFKTADDHSAPTGSVWIQTTAVNSGADVKVKKYNSTTAAFSTVSAPMHTTHAQALYNLDKSGAGANLTTENLYVQVNPTERDTILFAGDSTTATDSTVFDANASLGAYTVFKRQASGATTITGLSALGSSPFTAADTFTIRETLRPGDHQNSTKYGTFGPTTTVTLGGTSADDFVAAVAAAGMQYVSASYDRTSDTITMTHSDGGDFRMNDTSGTPVADAGFGSSNASTYASAIDTTGTKVANLYTIPAGAFGSDEVLASNWGTLVYEASASAPTADPSDLTYWYSSSASEVDIMVHDGTTWKGYKNVSSDARGFNLGNTSPDGVIVSATEPGATDGQSDGTALVDGDIWLDSSDLENYPKLYRYDSSKVDGAKWVSIDNTDQVSEDGILFADARFHLDSDSNVITKTPPTIKSLLTSDNLDIDKPDPTLYPKGMLLFNTRRSGYNVKQFRKNYFTRTNFGSTDDYPTLPAEADAWVTASGNKSDGSPYMGRKAQRRIVVKGLQSAVSSNTQLREEQREFNVLAAPGYVELIDELVTLSGDRGDTAFVVGDSPARLENSSTAISNWATNANSSATNDEDGLLTSDSFTAVYYPWGTTSDLAGNDVFVPPSHMVLRALAVNDDVAFPWFAPAGIRRGVVDNATSVGYIKASTGEKQVIAVSSGIRDTLQSNRVNPITFLTGAGLTIYGQKTRHSGTSALDRVNVARLTVFLRTQLDKLAQPFIFEPNDELTRNEIKQAVESFLLEVQGQRGLYDFAVVCDSTNNTPSRIDRNELHVDIAIEPVKSVEFIFIPIRLKNTGEIDKLGL